VPGGVVLLARVPAHGLEGAQAGVRCGAHELTACLVLVWHEA
jgi:hypothetical protein